MTNPKDSGRYDAVNDQWIDQQVRVDFAWGNIPMQPNDDRNVNLDETLDSHIIATSGYEGFPAFITGAPYDDTVENFVVPDVTGLTIIQATVALSAGDLSISEATSTVGATSGNNNKVKAQSIPAGTTVNVGSAITLTKYNYVAPATTGPISAIRYDAALPAGDYKMYLIGQTVKPTVGWTVTTTGNGNSFYNSIAWEVISVENDDAYNTGGTKVVLRNAAVVTTNEGIGGTWTKNV